MSKYALVSMLGNVGSTLGSQGGGYGLIATRMIKDLQGPEKPVDVNPEPIAWHSYDRLYVCEGVNFVEGSFNIPGGPQPEHYEKMKTIGTYKGQVVFINKTFDFEGFNKRLKIDGLSFPEATTINLFENYSKSRFSALGGKCIIGDSHALSVWRPSYSLDFTPGRTLHGFLNRRTPEEINTLWSGGVALYFGNIDLRFHLMRQSDPVAATVDLFNRYVEFAKKLDDCTLVELLPVEHESRKIPGTGLYKGQPFYGTRSERMNLRSIANQIIRDSGLKVISWPEEWVDEDGMKMLDILEQRQSVHLRPKNWKFIEEILK